MKTTKKQRKATAKKRARRKLHVNPLFREGSTVKVDFHIASSAPDMGSIESMGADILLRESVRGCTAPEKLLIASMMPMFLKLIRGASFNPLLVGRDTPHEADESTEANPKSL